MWDRVMVNSPGCARANKSSVVLGSRTLPRSRHHTEISGAYGNDALSLFESEGELAERFKAARKINFLKSQDRVARARRAGRPPLRFKITDS